MADKETGLNIPISTYADEKSVKIAIKDLTKDVLRSLKDGYIEVPAEIKTSFARGSKELDKAQKDVIAQWEKMSKKGFSSSGKELDELVEKYKRFKSLAGKEGKANSKQSKWLTNTIGELLQPYIKQKKDLDVILDGFKASVTKIDKTIKTSVKKSTRKSTKKSKSIDWDLVNELIDTVEEQKEYGVGKKISAPTHESGASKRSLYLSDRGGPYASKWQSHLTKVQKEAEKEAAKTLVQWTDKEQADEFMRKAMKKKKGRVPTNQEKAKGLSAATRTEIVELIHRIGKGDTSVSLEDFEDVFKTIYRLDQEAGVKLFDTIKNELNAALGPFYNTKGHIGVATDRDKIEESKNPVIEDMIKSLLNTVEKMEVAIIQELRALEKNDEWASTQNKKQPIIGKRAVTGGNSEVQKAIQETKQIIAELGSDIADISLNANLQKEKLERTYMQEIRESGREAKADEKEETNTKSSSESEAESLDQLKELGTKGFNNDATTDSLIRTINSIFAKTEIFDSILAKMTVFDDITSVLSSIHKTLENISSILDTVQKKGITINGGKGSKGGKKKKEEYTPDPRRLPVPYDPAIGGPIDDPKKFEAAYKRKETAFNRRDAVKAVEEELALFETGAHPSQLRYTPDPSKLPVLYDPTVGGPIDNTSKYEEAYKRKETAINRRDAVKAAEEELALLKTGKHSSQQRPEFSQTTIVTYRKGILGLFDKIAKNLSPMTEVDRIMAMNAEERIKARAARIEMFGENRGKSLMDTGDKASVRRVKQLFGWIYNRDSANKELFQDIKITSGLGEIDTTKIGYAINKVLSGSEMFKAQTGGTLRNLIGSMTGYIGMPSLEKSRTQAEGLNQIMANVRTEVLALLQDVKSKEMALQGMINMGTAKFKEDGTIDMEASSTGAQKIFTDLEEQKGVLKEALAEVQMIDEIIARSGGKVSKIMKQLGFVMPELIQNNTILQNINAGLDKSGKALKFQSRMGETLNYSFQLLSRHIGQIVKNWMMQLNPMIQIKKLYDDFVGYNVKFQRTMNVIKYNLRAIVRPMMDWIAQKIVNIIGFLDIVSMKIQEALGFIPISLFDQSAANAEKMRQELEEASDISAGFDELHDIGSSSSAADDLMGEIYKPQLSEKWKKLAEEIGNTLGGIFSGNMGFGEVAARILEIAKDAVSTLWTEIIKPFIDDVLWPAITNNWTEILKWVGGAFLAWNFLKWAGDKLSKALFGGIETLFKKIVNGISQTFFGKTVFDSVTKAAPEAGATAGGLFGKALYTGMNGSVVTVGKLLGGLTLTAGGAAGAITTAVKSGSNWEDMSTGAKIGSQALQGVFSAAAGLGAVLLGASGPVGWAVALGTFATAAAIGMAQVQDGIDSVKKEMQQLTEIQQLANQAAQEYDQALQMATTTANELAIAEQQTGLSGQELARQVENGTLSILNMTDAQFKVYEAYLKNEDAIKTLNEATKNKTEIDKKAVLQALEVEAANAIESDSYDKLLQSVQIAMREGSISAQEGGDIMSRALANASDKIQEEFREKMPLAIRECFDPNEYESDWRQFATKFKSTINSIKNWFVETWQGIKSWWSKLWGNNEVPQPSIPVPQGGNNIEFASLAIGTNYVPNDGLAYLHQGEAVIPKKYNQPYQPQSMSPEEHAYMNTMLNTMRSLDSTMKQGITVNGQFVQRGSDLVAVVNKTKSQTGADLLSNVAYAR